MGQSAKQRAEGCLGNLYTQFNELFFKGRLPTSRFLFAPERNKVFSLAGDDIIVGGPFMALMNPVSLYEHLLHEMVHVANAYDGIRDCTSNQYHNRNFRDGAMRVGFYVSRHMTRGWEITTFKPRGNSVSYLTSLEARVVAIRQLEFSPKVFHRAMEYMADMASKGGKPKKCFLKYICDCPPPHNSIRSGRRPNGSHPVNAICEACGSKFRHVGD